MPPLRAYPSEDTRPMGGHAALIGIFSAAAAGVVLEHRRSGRPLPENVPAGDLVLMSIGTYKLSRLIAKDRITSFVRRPFTRYKGESERPSEVLEEPRGTGMQRAVGELLVCPYCLAQWVGMGFLAAYLRDPRLARTVASLFTIVAGSDLLQQGWVAVDKHV